MAVTLLSVGIVPSSVSSSRPGPRGAAAVSSARLPRAVSHGAAHQVEIVRRAVPCHASRGSNRIPGAPGRSCPELPVFAGSITFTRRNVGYMEAHAEPTDKTEETDRGQRVMVPEKGQELREMAAETLQSLDETSKDKERIVFLLEELKEARELAKASQDVRMSLEAEAQQLGSLAINAKDEYEKVVAAALNATQEVQKLSESLEANEKEASELQSQLDKIKAFTAKMEVEEVEIKQLQEDKVTSPGESVPCDTKAEGAHEYEKQIQELEQDIQANMQQYVKLFQEKTDMEKQVESLQEEASTLEMEMTNAESFAASAMEAAAGGVAKEVECDNKVIDIESELQSLVRKLREDAEKMAKEKEKEEKKKAKEKKKEPVEITKDVSMASDGAAPKKDEKSEETNMKSKEDLMRSVEIMEELVYNSICEEYQTEEQTDDKKAKDAEVKKSVKTSKSSRFLAASFFSSSTAGEPEQLIPELKESLYRNRYIILGSFAVAAAVVGLINQSYFENVFASLAGALKGPIDYVASLAAKLPAILVSLAPEGLHIERGVIDTLVLLITSVMAVPLVCKLPGGSPVLGFLAGGAFIGPFALGLIQEVHAVQYLAEFGVVFLLFNIGLELSLDRLRSMRKYVFGLGSAQFLGSTAAIAGVSMLLGLSGPAAVIVGGALALSSTAVALQVLQDRGESGSRHGRATFSVLLLQDLAVVALLMLIPLLAPTGGGSVGLGQIAQALGMAAVKAVVCIAVIISAGRALLRPLFRQIAAFANAEIFAATTLLTCIGTSLLTQVAGLSMALGAFLAGLLLAETEFALQVESDIAPYRGLLLGLFFMTVGMEISFSLFVAKWQTILAGIAVLITGKMLFMAAIGPIFGLSRVASARAGFLLAPGGEFAFVAFGEAVSKGIVSASLSNQLFLVVALSMALTPYLAAVGQWLGSRYEQTDTKALVPAEGEVDDLHGHVIIAGFGRVGQVLAQIFSERLIPFVALDVRSDRVQAGRTLDLPVFFGDCGSAAVLHSVRAHHAACAVVALDSAAANYRAVWALSKNYPNVRVYVRAHDVQDGINLELAGASAVVPEILEPSLQLAAAVLGEMKMPPEEVAASIDEFRRSHLGALRSLTRQAGTSLGYGYSSDEDETEGSPESAADMNVPGQAGAAA